MASLINRACRQAIQQINLKNNPCYIVLRGTAVLPKKKQKLGTIKHRNLIKSSESSLAARGFLRSQKPYTPPVDAVARVKNVITQHIGAAASNQTLGRREKFQVLNACFVEFNHGVPNSLLGTINTPSDVLNFYTTAVSTTTPFDELKTKELPPNLHVQYDYVRYNPETDTMFGGVTAFPESSTIVSGLKFKDKYRGHKEKPPYYYDQWSDYIKHGAYKPGSK